MTPDELRRRRLALGMSQGQLAERLGVALNTISRWELGHLTPENPQMIDLALTALEQEEARR